MGLSCSEHFRRSGTKRQARQAYPTHDTTGTRQATRHLLVITQNGNLSVLHYGHFKRETFFLRPLLGRTPTEASLDRATHVKPLHEAT